MNQSHPPEILSRSLFMYKANLPKYIQDMFNNAHTHIEGKRSRQSTIINELFEKKGNSWVMNLEKPLFKDECSLT